MDATCTIQESIHVFSLVHKYVSRILGTYHSASRFLLCADLLLSFCQLSNCLCFGIVDFSDDGIAEQIEFGIFFILVFV